MLELFNNESKNFKGHYWLKVVYLRVVKQKQEAKLSLG